MEYWWLCRIVFLFPFIQSGSLVSWKHGEKTIRRNILNDLPENREIISLSRIVDQYFPNKYAQVTNHQLLKVFYDGLILTQRKDVSKSPNYMKCGEFNALAPWNFICISNQHHRWILKTGKRETRAHTSCECQQIDEYMDLSFRVSGKTDAGRDVSDTYMVHIQWVPRCVMEKNSYQDLRLNCKRNTSTIDTFLHEEVDSKEIFHFDIPRQSWRQILKISSLTFGADIPKSTFIAVLKCDDNFLTSLLINGSEPRHDVSKVCGGPARQIQFEPRWGRIIGEGLPKGAINVNYHVMEDFCNKNCVDKYWKWNGLVEGMSEKQRDCVDDPLHYDVAFKECDVRYDLSIVPSTNRPLFGGEIFLQCKPTSIILPYEVKWEKIGRNGEATVSRLTEFYRIRELSYDDEADYRCTLVIDGGKPPTIYDPPITSNRYRLSLDNVFTGLLKFNIPLGSRNVSEISDLKSDIEQKITTAILKKNARQPTRPVFNIDLDNGLTVEGGNILVVGSLKSVKTDRLPTYVKWVKDVNDVIKEEFSSVYIKILNEGACNSVTERWDSLRVTYTWPITGAGMIEQQPCPFNEAYFAYKRCAPGTNGKPARYEATNHTACSSVDKALAALKQIRITPGNAGAKSKEMLNMISRGKGLSGRDVSRAIDVLDQFRNFINMSEEVTDTVMNIVDGVMDLDGAVLQNSETQGQSTTRIVKLIGDFAEVLSASTPYTVSRKNFGFRGSRQSVDDFEGTAIDVTYGPSGMLISPEMGKKHDKDDDITAIVVRKAAKQQLPASENVTFVIISYKDDRLFVRSSNTTSSNNFTVNSHVISTEIRGHTIKNLPSAVTLTFSLQNTSIMPHDKMCTFWNFTTNDWSDAGCRVAGIDDIRKTVTCTCDHMTNFAVMFNAIPPQGIHGIILSYITYIGLSISLGGVFLTLLTFTLFPMLRTSIPPKVLMNLCVALIGMYLVFIIGATATPNTAGCKATAILLQYFFLAVFGWSAIEGFHSSRILITPLSVEINCFLQKALVFGWGAPLLFTAVGAGVWGEYYSGENYCVVRKEPFFYTVLVPILIVIIFNLTCIFAIACVLMSSSKKYKSSSMSMRNRVRILAGFVVLFGVTWIMGFFVVSNSVVGFQYAFCILCCLQGVYVFLLYGIKKGKQRQCWHKLLSGKSIAEIHRHFRLKSQAGTSGTRRGSGGVISRAVSTTSGGMGTSSRTLTSCQSLSNSKDLLSEERKIVASSARIELMSKPPPEPVENIDETVAPPPVNKDDSLVRNIVKRFEQMRQESIEPPERPLLEKGKSWSRPSSPDFEPHVNEDNKGDTYPPSSRPISPVDRAKMKFLQNKTSSDSEANGREKKEDRSISSVRPISPVGNAKTRLLESPGLSDSELNSDEKENSSIGRTISSPNRSKKGSLQRQQCFTDV